MNLTRFIIRRTIMPVGSRLVFPDLIDVFAAAAGYAASSYFLGQETQQAVRDGAAAGVAAYLIRRLLRLLSYMWCLRKAAKRIDSVKNILRGK
jgi:hypothetical protein